MVSPLHRSEQAVIVASIDGLLPIWPHPGISPGINSNPAGQTKKENSVLSIFTKNVAYSVTSTNILVTYEALGDISDLI